MSLCPSTFASGARTTDRTLTGEYSFDVPERRKDSGNGFGAIVFTWHVSLPITQTLAKKSVAKRAVQTIERSQLKLVGPIATIVGLSPFG